MFTSLGKKSTRGKLPSLSRDEVCSWTNVAETPVQELCSRRLDVNSFLFWELALQLCNA